MESPKDATKKAKLHSKLYLEVKTQAISFKTQEKTQNSRIKLKNSASHYSLDAEKMAKKQAWHPSKQEAQVNRHVGTKGFNLSQSIRR